MNELEVRMSPSFSLTVPLVILGLAAVAIGVLVILFSRKRDE